MLLIAVILYVAIAFALQTVRVDGESMVKTLQNQDLLLASKISYDFGGNPQRGDIVIRHFLALVHRGNVDARPI